MKIKVVCDNCGVTCEKEKGHVTRSNKQNAKIFCGKKCSSASRKVIKTDEQKKAEKAEYDRQYRENNQEMLRLKKAEYYQKTRDPEKEKQKRKLNMHKHVEYCRKPEYKEKKSLYDKKKRLDEYGYFAECKALLMELEKEVRSRATRYEIYIANGRFTRSAKERRRMLWQMRKN